ncbi:flagellar basal body P-ring protein FlgI [Pseudothermotoga thermarum]|uniref:Flagellar P-ring protein n=1 Tax=Pseudothermotoga thermarum DSM 5069 TaxID=688269 RepID=F7YVQ5_9THEM|nr:flagellar basal body P-ring protein FlgI [Pseudothermotoga thermarum]AEH51720.1 flagellar P-ring protein [Pseudothermotoga thermarum DSM 5069]
MRKYLAVFLLIIAVFSFATTRIKDIATFRGARDNQLFGVGIVVGLNGTGDSGNVSSQLLTNVLRTFNITINPNDFKSRNAALVMVVADIPPFYKEGMRLDVVVASIGDAKSLEGGVLLQTPLYGADGNVYAVAQGNVSLGGANVKVSANLQTKNRIVGYIPNGAIVEREIPFEFVNANTVTLLISKPDFTTAARVAEAINRTFERRIAKAIDGATVKIEVPSAFEDDVVTFLALVEEIEVTVDMPARVVVNERTGTVVFGGNVKILDFTLSYGVFNITVRNGKVVADKETEATVANLINALKSLGASPQDIIAILQTMHKAGVLLADLVVM